ncbi:unnamed protein product [Caenorhabditis angaria]|uniref:Uncharacterized protein n=1 Tax=Caenorhabditis angaria TaxID=860376 RepID=A0A9P1J2A7_9PELO|nr:unnamed protein product [Caenorhabditis angaria]
MSVNFESPSSVYSKSSTIIPIEDENPEYHEIKELFEDPNEYEVPDSQKHKNSNNDTNSRTFLVEPKWFSDYRAGKRKDSVNNIPDGFRITRKYEITTVACLKDPNRPYLPPGFNNTVKTRQDLSEINVESKERLIVIKMIEEKTTNLKTNEISTRQREELAKDALKLPERKKTPTPINMSKYIWIFIIVLIILTVLVFVAVRSFPVSYQWYVNTKSLEIIG